MAVLRSHRRAKHTRPFRGGYPAFSATGSHDGCRGAAAGFEPTRAEIPPQHSEFSDSSALVDLRLHVPDIPERIHPAEQELLHELLLRAVHSGVRGAAG